MPPQTGSECPLGSGCRTGALVWGPQPGVRVPSVWPGERVTSPWPWRVGVPRARQRRQGLLPAVQPSGTPACGRVTHFVSPPGTRLPVAGGITAPPNASFTSSRGLRSAVGQRHAHPRHAAAPVTLSRRAKVSSRAPARRGSGWLRGRAGTRGDARGRVGTQVSGVGWDAAGLHPRAPPADPACRWVTAPGAGRGLGVALAASGARWTPRPERGEGSVRPPRAQPGWGGRSGAGDPSAPRPRLFP